MFPTPSYNFRVFRVSFARFSGLPRPRAPWDQGQGSHRVPRALLAPPGVPLKGIQGPGPWGPFKGNPGARALLNPEEGSRGTNNEIMVAKPPPHSLMAVSHRFWNKGKYMSTSHQTFFDEQELGGFSWLFLGSSWLFLAPPGWRAFMDSQR